MAARAPQQSDGRVDEHLAPGNGTTAPEPEADQYADLPDELKALRQWTGFRKEWDEAKQKSHNVPINVHTGAYASVSDPQTWATYEEAVANYLKGTVDGLSFVLTPTDPYWGIDGDNCRDPETGALAPWASELVWRIDSYTEASPSGRGLRIFGKGTLPGGGINRRWQTKDGSTYSIELYDRGKVLTVTGAHLPGTPTTLEPRHAEVSVLYAELGGKPEAREQRPRSYNPAEDDTILNLARVAKNGARFRALFDEGAWREQGYASQSEAELSLCSTLAFYCGNDPKRIHRLYPRSALYCQRRATARPGHKPKWEEKHFSDGRTYGEATVSVAIAGMRAFYAGVISESADEESGTTGTDDAPFAQPAADAPNTPEPETPTVDPHPQDNPEAPPHPKEWPCPEHLWRGPFLAVANILGKRSWEIWLGTFTALAARAHCNIYVHYHIRPLYGMSYALLIKPTGSGKGLATDVAQALMPSWYVVRDAPQSGPALAPILAEITREKGKVTLVKQRPALIVAEEFTVLLKNAGIQNSTLIDVVNTLFHREYPWTVTRSEKSQGGGDVVIPNPTLSILGTTTESLFAEYISEMMIRAGFLNRFLILPGATARWKFYDPEGATAPTAELTGLFDRILPPHRAFGLGKSVWEMYDPDAQERLVAWGEQTFAPIMNSDALEAESSKRLHMYAHIIDLNLAYAEGTARINLAHVECAISVVDTAREFLLSLLRQDRDAEIPKFKAYEINLEQKILTRVTAKPGITRRAVLRSLINKKTATSGNVTTMINHLVQSGELVEAPDDGKNPKRVLYRAEDAPRTHPQQEDE